MRPFIRDPSTGRTLDAIEVLDSESGQSLGIVDSIDALEALRRSNLTLDTDLYELTMVAGYRLLGRGKRKACFDLYYRQNPDDGAFCIFAGLDSVIDYIKNLGIFPDRSEERRVGKECRSRWSPYH